MLPVHSLGLIVLVQYALRCANILPYYNRYENAVTITMDIKLFPVESPTSHYQ